MVGKRVNSEAIIKLVFRGIIPIVFLISGVTLFVSEKSAWGVVLGLPMIVIGSVMVIYTYDEVIKKKVHPLAEELTRCVICGKLTPRVVGVIPEDTICSDCKEDIKEGIKKKKRG